MSRSWTRSSIIIPFLPNRNGGATISFNLCYSEFWVIVCRKVMQHRSGCKYFFETWSLTVSFVQVTAVASVTLQTLVWIGLHWGRKSLNWNTSISILVGWLNAESTWWKSGEKPGRTVFHHDIFIFACHLACYRSSYYSLFSSTTKRKHSVLITRSSTGKAATSKHHIITAIRNFLYNCRFPKFPVVAW